MHKTGSSGRTIQSLDRAFLLVSALSTEAEGLSLTELAAAAGLAPQTVQSLLRTLQAHGWVVQSGRGRPYVLGPAPLQLASRWWRGHGPAASARAAVVELSRRVGEYVLLAELHGVVLLPLVEQRPERELMLGATEFGPDRIHAMATGQVLLAALPEAIRQRTLAALPLPARGPRTIVDPGAFAARLHEVAATGWCVCRGEAGDHVAALAVPVRDASGAVRAALGISLPELRLTTRREAELLTDLRQAKQAIEARWGREAGGVPG